MNSCGSSRSCYWSANATGSRTRASSRSPASRARRCAVPTGARACLLRPNRRRLRAGRLRAPRHILPKPAATSDARSPTSGPRGQPRPGLVRHPRCRGRARRPRSRARPARDPRRMVDPLAGARSVRRNRTLPRQRATMRSREELAALADRDEQRPNRRTESSAALSIGVRTATGPARSERSTARRVIARLGYLTEQLSSIEWLWSQPSLQNEWDRFGRGPSHLKELLNR